MDQYPDENEEYELQYQDELELLEDLPDEFNEAPAPSTSKQKENIILNFNISNVKHFKNVISHIDFPFSIFLTCTKLGFQFRHNFKISEINSLHLYSLS